MPEFVQRDLLPKKTLMVNFATLKDMEAFAELIGQTVNETTRSVWYPDQPELKLRGLARYIAAQEMPRLRKLLEAPTVLEAPQ
jgi:hypothetical protein